MPTTLVVVALFLHNLFTAAWIGGMVVLAVAVLPAVRGALGPGAEARKLVRLIQRRLSIVAYVSMIGLALTGLPLSRRTAQFTGLFSFATPYSSLLTAKHLLVIAMIAIALVRSLTLAGPAGEPASTRRPESGAPGGNGALGSGLDKRNFGLLALNALLGAGVLLLTAMMETI